MAAAGARTTETDGDGGLDYGPDATTFGPLFIFLTPGGFAIRKAPGGVLHRGDSAGQGYRSSLG